MSKFSMVERNRETTLPVSWSEWDILDILCIQLYEVIFEDDFGPIKKGAEFDCMSIDYETGTIDLFLDDEKGRDGIPETTIKFVLTVKPLD